MSEASLTLAKRLLTDHSKNGIERIAMEIGDDTDSFATLMDVFFSGPYRVTHFSAHVVSKCCDHYPHLILPYLGRMIDLLDKNVHDSLKRNIVRTMQFIDIPEEHWASTVDQCFRLMLGRKEAVAIRVFAMTVLANLSSRIPEIAGELLIAIEDQMPYESPAFTSRGTKILRKLKESQLRPER